MIARTYLPGKTGARRLRLAETSRVREASYAQIVQSLIEEGIE